MATKKIILVEDNENNQLLIQDIFYKYRQEYDLVIIGTSEEALKYLSTYSFDLLLLDMRLPQISGWDIAKILRGQYHCQTPIIAVTAHAMKGDRERSLEAGCNDFITKPIQKETLLEKVRHWTA